MEGGAIQDRRHPSTGKESREVHDTESYVHFLQLKIDQIEALVLTQAFCEMVSAAA